MPFIRTCGKTGDFSLKLKTDRRPEIWSPQGVIPDCGSQQNLLTPLQNLTTHNGLCNRMQPNLMAHNRLRNQAKIHQNLTPHGQSDRHTEYFLIEVADWLPEKSLFVKICNKTMFNYSKNI